MDHPRSQFPVPVRLPTFFFFQGLLEHFVTDNLGMFTGKVTTFEDEETPIVLQCQEQILKLRYFLFFPALFALPVFTLVVLAFAPLFRITVIQRCNS